MQINPKTRFLATPAAKNFPDQIAADWFQNAAEIAVAEYASRLGRSANPQASWDAHNRLTGALEFLNVLMNLGNPTQKPALGESINLDWSPPGKSKEPTKSP